MDDTDTMEMSQIIRISKLRENRWTELSEHREEYSSFCQTLSLDQFAEVLDNTYKFYKACLKEVA